VFVEASHVTAGNAAAVGIASIKPICALNNTAGFYGPNRIAGTG
jgi:hypothetical protein